MAFWIIGAVVAVLVVAAFLALYRWLRRSERDIDLTPRDLTDAEKEAQLPGLGAMGNYFSGTS